jgi:acyl-CoA thioester hydrolase
MESGRVAYFDQLGLWSLSQPGVIGPAVVSLTCNFRAQVRYPDRLEVGSRVTDVGSRKFTLLSEIYRAGTDQLVADGSCVTVWVDYQAGRAIPFPAELAAAIRSFERAPA